MSPPFGKKSTLALGYSTLKLRRFTVTRYARVLLLLLAVPHPLLVFGPNRLPACRDLILYVARMNCFCSFFLAF